MKRIKKNPKTKDTERAGECDPDMAGQQFSPPAWTHATVDDIKQFVAVQLATASAPWLVEFLFEEHRPELRLRPHLLLNEISNLSSAERVLARVAMDIWGGCGGVKFLDIVHNLSEGDFENVMFAVKTLRKQGI